MPQNAPKLLKMALLWILRKLAPWILMKLTKKVETNWMLHNFVYLYSGITLGCALGGALLGPFWGYFLMFVQNRYVVIVVFIHVTLNSKFQFKSIAQNMFI